jgi:Peptidase A4 family
MKLRSKVFAAACTGVLCGSTLALAAGSNVASAGTASGARNLRAPLPAGMGGARAVHSYTQGASYNWSGWAQDGTSGKFKSVVDTWKVPTVNTSLSGTQYSSDWVGIGGFSDSSLVQAGTEADHVSGVAVYRAWTEVLPAAEDPLSLTVHPGDTIKTTVKLVKNNWVMTVDDVTTGQSGSRQASKASAGSTEASVEAIHERPCIADGCTSVSDFANLTETNNVTFNPGYYGKKSKPKTPLLKAAPGATVYQLFMLNNAGNAYIASPSNPNAENDGFTVAYGSTQPPPPA